MGIFDSFGWGRAAKESGRGETAGRRIVFRCSQESRDVVLLKDFR